MHFRQLIISITCIWISTSSYSQGFEKFEALNQKGDSAYSAKNYALSSRYYEQAIQLPLVLKPDFHEYN